MDKKSQRYSEKRFGAYLCQDFGGGQKKIPMFLLGPSAKGLAWAGHLRKQGKTNTRKHAFQSEFFQRAATRPCKIIEPILSILRGLLDIKNTIPPLVFFLQSEISLSYLA